MTQPEQHDPYNSDRRSKIRYQRDYGGIHNTPNSTAVLVLGILSIVFCWCYGLLSIVLGIITLVMAAEGEKQYRLNPGMYSLSSYNNLKAGRTCAWIGLGLAMLTFICALVYFFLMGTLFINLLDYNWF